MTGGDHNRPVRPGKPRGELGRGRMSLTKRIELLEHDRAEHSRALTGLVDSVQKGFSEAQLEQLKTVFGDALADAGLRVDEPEQVDEAREDFRWLRRTRLAWDGAARKIGTAILGGGLVILGVVLATGFWSWISHAGKPPT